MVLDTPPSARGTQGGIDSSISGPDITTVRSVGGGAGGGKYPNPVMNGGSGGGGGT